MTHFGDDQFGRVGIDRLVDGRHHTHAHHRLDHVGAALGHTRGELLHRDDLGNDDLAIDLLLRLVVMLLATLAIETAALLGDRTAAEIVLARNRTAHVDLVGPALRRVTARARRLRQPLVYDRTQWRTAQRAGTRTGTRCTQGTADGARRCRRGASLDFLRLARGLRL